jgi:hypothetical protein
MGTCPAKRRLASSTEGASRLQVLQPGAQNHSASGPVSKLAASKLPPPITGIETAAVDEAVDEVFDEAVGAAPSAPHAANPPAHTSANEAMSTRPRSISLGYQTKPSLATSACSACYATSSLRRVSQP